jgi:hypothetical protein
MEADWKHYERGLLAWFRYSFLKPNFEVHGTVAGRQHRVPGRLSLSKRQLDAAVYRSGEGAPFLIADAKFHARPINVTHVEAFIGLMEDVGATHGVLATPNGPSKSAQRRAEAADVDVYPMSLDDALAAPWYLIAHEVYPYDRAFHPQLTRVIRALKTNGCPQEVETGLESVAFEEWERFVWWTLGHHPEEGVSLLIWVARYHHDDGWVYNAARILEEGGLMPPELRAELLGRPDADLHKLLDSPGDRPTGR